MVRLFDFKSDKHFVASSDRTNLKVYQLSHPITSPSSIRKTHWREIVSIISSRDDGSDDDDDDAAAESQLQEHCYDGLLFFDGHGKIEGREALTKLAQHLTRLHLMVSPGGYCFQDAAELGEYKDFGVHYLRLNDQFDWSRHGVNLVTTTVWPRLKLKYVVPKQEKDKELEKLREEMDDELQKLSEERDEELQNLREEMEKASEAKNEELRKLRKEKDEELRKLIKKKDGELQVLKKKDEAAEEVEKAMEEETMKKLNEKDDELRKLRKDKDEELRKLLQKKEIKLQIIKKGKDEELQKLRDEMEEETERLIRVKDEEVEKIENEKEELQKLLKKKDDELKALKKVKDADIARVKKELEQCCENSWSDSARKTKIFLELQLSMNQEEWQIHSRQRRPVPPETFRCEGIDTYSGYRYFYVPKMRDGQLNPFCEIALLVNEEMTARSLLPPLVHVETRIVGQFDVNNWWFTKALHREGGVTMLAYYDGHRDHVRVNTPMTERPIRLPYSKNEDVYADRRFFFVSMGNEIRLAFAYRV
ncbi:unnamed protein product [Linum tenue]|uniref:Uncharacterized protein n=1 Tax=Linum tenue TaxID=586396 RepID=A0AAV0P8Z8_9ROSI|nr:unnamed protein product [Linum tenue]